MPDNTRLTGSSVVGGEPALRPAVVIVDWNVTKASPIGSSILELLQGLHDRYQFVVVAAYFESPSPETIQHVRVRLPSVPSFIKELCWPSIVRLAFRRRELRRLPSHITRATQGQLPGADISSAHFCHRAYLRTYFSSSGTKGLRRVSRFLVHRHGARLEKKAFQRARVITVPSMGLWREIAETYPFSREKLIHVPNPVDTARFALDDAFDRDAARAELGFGSDDIVFAFVALGDFARKGLEIGIRGLALLGSSNARILVVGGTKSEIALFRSIAAEAGVDGSMRFVGLQSDIRPYLWLSDAFLFPTIYEAGSKAVLQAAAAGLPMIATRIHGIEDMLEHGVNGWFAERTAEAFSEAMSGAVGARDALPDMGRRARVAANAYDRRFFIERWDRVLTQVVCERGAVATAPSAHPLPGPSMVSAENERA
jgi:glycosyltransferase involved in cell wall biosynthesis